MPASAVNLFGWSLLFLVEIVLEKGLIVSRIRGQWGDFLFGAGEDWLEKGIRYPRIRFLNFVSMV